MKECHEKEFTQDEVRWAIQHLNKGKTPGPDGLPAEFYQYLCDELVEFYTSLINHCYQSNQLFQSGLQGILNLIPKPGKDSRMAKNLRPITLLNNDYKIIEKCIAKRLNEMTEAVINLDQTGFMPGRRISVNIRKVLDVISYCNNNEIDGVILDLDMEKAFDKLAFEAIYGSLNYFNAAQYIINWIKILYTGFNIRIQNNGKFSECLEIRRGIHQGGVCSAQLFILAMELIAIDIRANTDILGINVENVTSLLLQFADDTDLTMLNDQKSVQTALDTLSYMQTQTGLTVSYDKTSLYRIGSLRKSKALLYTQPQLKYSEESITVLGVKIHNQENQLCQDNYSPLLRKTKERLNHWTNRSLSLIGKICVINTLIASLFIYQMLVLPILPVKFFRSFEAIIREFIWNGNKAHIALDTLYQSKNMGGLGLTNLRLRDKAMKISWLKILIHNPAYATIAYAQVSTKYSLLKHDIWKCNMHQKDIKLLQPGNKFWRDVICTWSELNYDAHHAAKDQFVWLNSFIRVQGQPIMWSTSYNKGLKWIMQLFPGGKIITPQQAWSKFSLTFFQLSALLKAIPAQWKHELENSLTESTPETLYDKCVNKKNIASYIYHSLLNESGIDRDPFKTSRWMEILNIQHHEKFNRVSSSIYSVTNIPKYRSFQYRLLNLSVVTNVHLLRWKLSESDKCYYCKLFPETTQHLFLYCNVVLEFWEKVKEIMREYSSDIDTSSYALIFNKVSPPKTHVNNFICLLAKQYIYSTRCLNGHLSIEQFLFRLNSTRNSEKYIAIKNLKLQRYYAKWEPALVSNYVAK